MARKKRIDAKKIERELKKVITVMPAYNAESTLEQTVRDIPSDCVDEIILVDDCSQDNTVALAKQLNLTVIEHSENKGYGGNQKSCYDIALERGADIVVMIHPDYQYDSRLVPYFLGFLRKGICDVILGSRIRSRQEAFDGGMPAYKYISNRFLTTVENLVMGQNLGDFHSGFRAYTREVLVTINYHAYSDDFVFDTQLLAQAAFLGFKIGDAPIPVRYFPEASSINLIRSIVYGIRTLWVTAQFLLQKIGLARFKILKKLNADS